MTQTVKPCAWCISASPPWDVTRALNPCRSIAHTVSRVKSGGSTAYLLTVAGLIVCKDAGLFEAFSRPWTPPSTFYKLL